MKYRKNHDEYSASNNWEDVFKLSDLPTRIAEDIGEIRIYFWPKKINVDEGTIKQVLNGLVFGGNCIGYDVTRLRGGEIRLFFNPIFHCEYDKNHSVTQVMHVLRKSVLNIDEDEVAFDPNCYAGSDPNSSTDTESDSGRNSGNSDSSSSSGNSDT